MSGGAPHGVDGASSSLANLADNILYALVGNFLRIELKCSRGLHGDVVHLGNVIFLILLQYLRLLLQMVREVHEVHQFERDASPHECGHIWM